MAKKRSLWLYGCGLGCVVIALGVAGLIGAGVLFFNRLNTGFTEAVTAREQLEQRHGAPETFTPWPDGSIPPDRMERFLQVRQAMSPAREALASAFERLPMSREKAEELKKAQGFEKFVKVLSVGRGALGLGTGIAQFFSARDHALLEADMGMGEYTWLYSLAYHAWLGHDPEEGPIQARSRNARGGPGTESADPGAGWGEAAGRESGEDSREPGGPRGGIRMGPGVQWRVRDELLQMLRNQHAALDAGAPAAWRESLAAEIAAMEKDEERPIWQEGVPGPTGAALEPYRARLEAAYSGTTNPFELSRTKRQGRFSYGAD